jgi:hypothetical protein
MRGTGDSPRLRGNQRWLEQQVQLSRGHWRREDARGAVRSAGWWESVTVTWSPAAMPQQPPALWQRALAAAVDTIAPSIAALAAAGARHLLERQHGPGSLAAPARRQLPAARKALPRSQRPR